MRIQHNIMAMNAYRNYTNNVSAMKGNLEKLSSGYKINRAGDDAAGLAISEKMRAQITGLTQAQANAKSAINLVQTAEGALQEVQDMLNRMVKLAEQSANGTYDDGVDRNQLQKEFEKLTKEIDRINQAANFNGKTLFGGAADDDSTASYLEASDVTWNSAKVTGTDVAKVDATKAKYTYELTTALDNSTDKSITIAGQTIQVGAGKTIDSDSKSTVSDQAGIIRTELGKISDISSKYDISGTGAQIILTAKTEGVDAKATDMKATPAVASDSTATGEATAAETTKGAAEVPAHKIYDFTGTPKANDTVTIDGKTYTFKDGSDGTDGKTFKDLDTLITAAGKNGVTIDKSAGDDKVTISKAASTADDDADTDTDTDTASGGGSFSFQVGDTNADYNKISLTIKSIASTAIKDISEGTGKTLSELDVKTETTAGTALSALKGMVNYISDIRGELGATQNRLTHTINNLSVMTENIQDAESTIRDTDVADEMMAYTKNNILIQSAQAMLAQANQVPQGVLQLLQ